MTETDLMLALAGVLLLALYLRLFRTLSQERWQFLAAIPLYRLGDGRWRGLNLTLYGALTALAGLCSAASFVFLTGAVGVAVEVGLALLAAVLAVCLPAARWVARVVEGNPHGFTVGGASFVGILLAPVFLWIADGISFAWYHEPLPVMALLAAISISYVLGEGVGRLACISFGCCYGKPVAEAPAWLRQRCAHFHHRVEGSLRKAAFASRLQGALLIPVQAMTCIVFTMLALFGAGLFFHGQFEAALLVSLLGSQGWRVASEQLRADYRGNGRTLSAYQVMSILACVYVAGVTLVLPGDTPVEALAGAGVAALWQPAVVLSLQAMAFGMFLFTGTSTITRSDIGFGLSPGWEGETESARGERESRG